VLIGRITGMRLLGYLKVWLENNLSQFEGGAMGGRVQVEKQAVESKDPKWRPVVSSKEKLHYVGVILPDYTA